MNAVYYRIGSIENSIHGIQVTYIKNQTTFLNNGQNEMMEYYNANGLTYEQEYQNLILKQSQTFFSGI